MKKGIEKIFLVAGIISIMGMGISNTVCAETPFPICEEDEILYITDGDGFEASVSKYFDCNGNSIGNISFINNGHYCDTIKVGSVKVGEENDRYIVYCFDNPIRIIAEYPKEQIHVVAGDDGYLVCDETSSQATFYDKDQQVIWSQSFADWAEERELMYSVRVYHPSILYDENYVGGMYIPFGGSETDPISGQTNMEYWIPYDIVDGAIAITINGKTYGIMVYEDAQIRAVNNQNYLVYENGEYSVRDLSTGEVVYVAQDRERIIMGRDFFFVKSYVYDENYNTQDKLYLPDGTEAIETYKITGKLIPWRNNLIYVKRGAYIGLVDLEGNWVIKVLKETAD